MFALIRLKDLRPFKLDQIRVHHMRVNLNFVKYTHWQSNITQPHTHRLSSGCAGSPHVGRESLVTRKTECYRAVTWVQKGHVVFLGFFFSQTVTSRESEMYWHITRENRLREHTRDVSNLTPFSPPALYFTLVVWTGRSPCPGNPIPLVLRHSALSLAQWRLTHTSGCLASPTCFHHVNGDCLWWQMTADDQQSTALGHKPKGKCSIIKREWDDDFVRERVT